ncbi:hypothetical protein [Streptomyces sp. DG1A-41]|uniref:hypothetical protein n=1 Tax=Streptomyces sp. DG1A-41 TaxID=3125779 RepID=UPI0030CEBC85
MGPVRGFSPPSEPGRLGLYAAAVLASIVVWTLLKATRIKWFGEVRDFEKAVRLDGTDPALATERFLRDRPFSPRSSCCTRCSRCRRPCGSRGRR